MLPRPPHGRATSPACSGRRRAPRRSRRRSRIPASATSPSTSWSRAYAEATAGLLEGGADLLLVETIFDTLNAKAALFAHRSAPSTACGYRVPVMISGTITDRSGRTLSGQTAEAFWISVAHARPLSIGLNCALGARPAPRPTCRSSRAAADTCGLGPPERRSPQRLRRLRPRRRQHGGRRSAPGHARGSSTSSAAAAAPRPTTSARLPRRWRACAPRQSARRRPAVTDSPDSSRSSIGPDTNFVNVGERTNVTGSRRFASLITEGRYDAALPWRGSRSRPARRCSTSTWTRDCSTPRRRWRRFLRLIAAEPAIARVPVMLDSSKWSVLEAGLKNLQGKGVVNSISLKEGEAAFLPAGRAGAALRRGRGGDGVRRTGPGRDRRAEGRHPRARLPPAGRSRRLRAGGRDPRPERLRGRHRHRGARRLWRRVRRGGPRGEGALPRCAHQRRHQQRLLLLPRQRSACARRSTPSSSTTPSRAGLDMGIVNAGAVAGARRPRPPTCASASRIVLWNRRADATERLLEVADRAKTSAAAPGADLAWRDLPVDERLAQALVHGHRRLMSRQDVEEARLRAGAPARRDRGAADGRDERRRRPLRQPARCSCRRW